MRGDNFEATREQVGVNISHILDASRTESAMYQQETLPKITNQYAVVGDLDGDYNAFLDMCLEIWFLDSSLHWCGGSLQVVFSGDILADAIPNGFDILRHIRLIREQARKVGGDITVLAGNHEEFMIGYLAGESVNQWTNEIQEILKGMTSRNGIVKAKWLTELLAFWKTRNEILANMRQDTQLWRPMLEEMTEMKLMEITWDTLHFHTPPNKAMLQLISHWWNPIDAVERINHEWKQLLQELLLGEVVAPSTLFTYKKYASIFLQTANDTREALASRVNCTVDEIPEKYLASIVADEVADYSVLKNYGITSIIYGHTNSVIEVEGIRFVRANRKSFAFDAQAPVSEAPMPEVITPNAPWANDPQNLDQSIHEELQNERKKILSIVKVDFVDFHFQTFSNSGYKQAFLLPPEFILLVQAYHLDEYLAAASGWIFTIKTYPNGMALRLDFSYLTRGEDRGAIIEKAPEDIRSLITSIEALIERRREYATNNIKE